MLNFLATSAGFVFVSHRLFTVTNDLKSAFIPHDDNPQLLRNIIIMAATVGLLWGVCWASMTILGFDTTGGSAAL